MKEYYSASVVAPNTTETDQQLLVLHRVTWLEYGCLKTIQVRAGEPTQAIALVRAMHKNYM